MTLDLTFSCPGLLRPNARFKIFSHSCYAAWQNSCDFVSRFVSNIALVFAHCQSAVVLGALAVFSATFGLLVLCVFALQDFQFLVLLGFEGIRWTICDFALGIMTDEKQSGRSGTGAL